MQFFRKKNRLTRAVLVFEIKLKKTFTKHFFGTNAIDVANFPIRILNCSRIPWPSSLTMTADEMLPSEFFKKFILSQKKDGREILREFPSEFRSERVSETVIRGVLNYVVGCYYYHYFLFDVKKF